MQTAMRNLVTCDCWAVIAVGLVTLLAALVVPFQHSVRLPPSRKPLRHQLQAEPSQLPVNLHLKAHCWLHSTPLVVCLSGSRPQV